MTETIKYQTYSTQPHEDTAVSFVRRLVLRRRYGRLLSSMAQLGQVVANVQFNLCKSAMNGALRRSS